MLKGYRESMAMLRFERNKVLKYGVFLLGGRNAIAYYEEAEFCHLRCFVLGLRLVNNLDKL